MELNFKSYGKGPGLIILHGLLGSLDNWVTLARQLGEDYSVFVLDQRNHGKSPHTEKFSYPLLAEDLAEFMAQQGIFHAHILGHSMGGKAAMTFAGLYPEKIDKLIVADMAPRAYSPHHNEIFEALRSLDLRNLESRQDAEAFLEGPIPDTSVRQFLLKSLNRTRENGYQWKFNLASLYQNYPRILEAVSLDIPFDRPSLFLYGGNSPYVKEHDFAYIREHFSEAEFEEIPGTGHWLHAEAPEIFLDKVRQFLS